MSSTKGLITMGKKFTSIHFEGTCEMISADVDTNELVVRIVRIDEQGKEWSRNEPWNLQHTVFGFENGDYQEIIKDKQ